MSEKILSVCAPTGFFYNTLFAKKFISKKGVSVYFLSNSFILFAASFVSSGSPNIESLK